MTKAELRKIVRLTYLTETGDKAKEKVMRTQIGVMATKIKTLDAKIQLLKIQMEDLKQKKAATIAKATDAINERKFFIEHTMEQHKEDLAELLTKQTAENNNMSEKEVAAEIGTEPQKVVDAFTRAAAEDATAMFSAPPSEPPKNAKISPVSSSGKESSGEAPKTQNTTPKQHKNEDVVSPAKERDIQDPVSDPVSAETSESTRTPENGKNKAVSGSGKESTGEAPKTQESTQKQAKNDDPADEDPFSWLNDL
ncbi:hypothetical protein [Mitsuokella multacida]|uniref:hypothetical protein n=1 Tax=Mitsuokella multacida TaxID=52226 RepID=UPI00241E04B3|nr:hypothetical protein [Mitsuokella multacida]